MAVNRTMHGKVYQQSTVDVRKDDAFYHSVACSRDAVADAGALPTRCHVHYSRRRDAGA